MIIKLYNNKSDPEEVNKNLTLFKDLTTPDHSYILGADKLHANFNNLKIEGANEVDMRRVVNYMEVVIDEIKECYYIDNIIYHNGLYDLITTKDVICTHWQYIKECDAIINRSASKFNLELVDNGLRIENAPGKLVYEFPHGFNPTANTDVIMVTVGDGHNIFS